MGFDQNDPRPTSLTTHKKTTKVNIGVVVGVIVFFAVAGVFLFLVGLNPNKNSSELHEKMTTESPRPATP